LDTECSPAGPCGFWDWEEGAGANGDIDDDYGWYDIHGECLFVHCPEPCSWDSCDDPNPPIEVELKEGWGYYWLDNYCVYMSNENGKIKNLENCGERFGFEKECNPPNCIPPDGDG
jgi:hypothetical protein